MPQIRWTMNHELITKSPGSPHFAPVHSKQDVGWYGKRFRHESRLRGTRAATGTSCGEWWHVISETPTMIYLPISTLLSSWPIGRKIIM